MNLIRHYILMLLTCSSLSVSYAQDSTSLYHKILSSPEKLFSRIQKKTDRVEQQLTRQTEKYLQQLECQELKLQKKLAKKDSLLAQKLFGNSQAQYQQLRQQLKTTAGTTGNQYSGQLDSMQTAIHYLQQNKLLNNLPAANTKAIAALKSYSSLQEKLNQTANIRKQLDQRKQYLKTQLQQSGLTKAFKQYQQKLYYYKAQVEEYKATLENPDKIQKRLLQEVQKQPAFKNFFGKYSQLAALFPEPAGYGSNQALAGLQTRAAVQSSIQNQIAAGGPGAQSIVQQNIQAAQGQLQQLKNRINKLGNAGADMEDMPNFKPKSTKTKTFKQRLEWGTNLQSQRANNYFPTSTDAALTLGYKLTDKSVIGIGLSAGIGWGKSIKQISITSQGVGFRSYADMKLKGSFYASGGFEYNYQKPFNAIQQLYTYDNWRKSGLIGISKVVSLKSKVFKKTKLQFLWDFMSYQQRPISQPVKFRVGYGF